MTAAPETGPHAGGAPQPRAPGPEELPAVVEMLDRVFRPSGESSMARDYPRFLSRRNVANLRVMEEEGRIASHAGATLRGAIIEGVPVGVACMGAVATDPSSRGKGYASACVGAVCRHAAASGADLMLISGGRTLYTRLGARAVGDHRAFKVTQKAAGRFSLPELEVRPLEEKDLAGAARLYSLEPVRFVRPLEDWAAALRYEFAMDKPCRFLGIRKGGELVAYAVVYKTAKGVEPLVVEKAGWQAALLGALKAIMGVAGVKRLSLHVPEYDVTMLETLRLGGMSGDPVPASGTVVVLRFESLMEKLGVRLLERLGEEEALRFEEEGPPLGAENRFLIACGDDSVRIEGRGNLAEFLFGLPGGKGLRRSGYGPLAKAEGPARPGALGEVFPVPALWYGLNYV